MNLLRDLSQLQVPGRGVEQDQIGLKMKRGMKCASAVIFLPDEITPRGLQSRAHERGQMRLVIDQQDALGNRHKNECVGRSFFSSRCAMTCRAHGGQVLLFNWSAYA